MVGVSELAKQAVLSELLHVDYLVLTSDMSEELRDKFLKWKEAFESKCLKVNIGKAKVMVSSSISKDGLCKGKVDPCGVCCLIVKYNSVLCGKGIHSICAGVKRVTATFS